MDPRAPLPPPSLALGLEHASGTVPQQIAPADNSYEKKATEAAVKFESFFIGHMLKQMRSSTKELAGDDSIYKNSVNSDMLDMADTLVADQMAHQRAFGIADAILRQLLPGAPAPRDMPTAAAQPTNNVSTKKIFPKT